MTRGATDTTATTTLSTVLAVATTLAGSAGFLPRATTAFRARRSTGNSQGSEHRKRK